MCSQSQGIGLVCIYFSHINIRQIRYIVKTLPNRYATPAIAKTAYPYGELIRRTRRYAGWE